MEQIDYSDERLLAAVKLDPKKEKAVVFPPEKGAHFHQDGFYFDHRGNLAPEMLDNDAKARLRKLLNKRIVSKQMEKVKLDFMKEHGLRPEDLDDVDTVIAVATSKDNGGPIDIAAWARGEVKYPFWRVIDFMRDKHSFEGHDVGSIVDFLVNNDIVAESAVRVG